MSSIVLPKVIATGFPLKYASHSRDFQHVLEISEKYIDSQDKAAYDTLSMLFMQGTKFLASADISLETGDPILALKFFEKAEDQFLQIKGQQEFDKASLSPDFKYEINRRIFYIKGRVSRSYGYISRKNQDAEEYVRHLIQAGTDYSEEMIFERNELDYYNLVATLRNLYLVYVDLADFKARKDSINIQEQRKNLYIMKTNARKAIFLGAEFEDKFFDNIENRLLSLMTRKFTERCDEIFDKGAQLSAEESHDKASMFFHKGEKIYNGLKRVVDSPDFRLQEQIFKLHKIESIAKNHLLKDDNDAATHKFREAKKIIQSIVTTVKEFGDPSLIYHFQLNAKYFDAMSIFCNGLKLFDKEEYTESKQHFAEVKETLQELSQEAEKISKPLTQSCNSAMTLVESYTETLNLLMEE